MSLAPTLAETERAKSQLKASLLLGLDGTTAIAEDVSHFLVDLYQIRGRADKVDRTTDDHYRKAIHTKGD